MKSRYWIFTLDALVYVKILQYMNKNTETLKSRVYI